MVNFRDETNFRSGHGVVLGQKQLQLEHAAFERGALRTYERNEPKD